MILLAIGEMSGEEEITRLGSRSNSNTLNAGFSIMMFSLVLYAIWVCKCLSENRDKQREREGDGEAEKQRDRETEEQRVKDTDLARERKRDR